MCAAVSMDEDRREVFGSFHGTATSLPVEIDAWGPTAKSRSDSLQPWLDHCVGCSSHVQRCVQS